MCDDGDGDSDSVNDEAGDDDGSGRGGDEDDEGGGGGERDINLGLLMVVVTLTVDGEHTNHMSGKQVATTLLPTFPDLRRAHEFFGCSKQVRLCSYVRT